MQKKQYMTRVTGKLYVRIKNNYLQRVSTYWLLPDKCQYWGTTV